MVGSIFGTIIIIAIRITSVYHDHEHVLSFIKAIIMIVMIRIAMTTTISIALIVI